MAWDFTVDSEKQMEIATKLRDSADKYDTQVQKMYGEINNLGSHWVGEDYDMYKAGTEGYKNALQDLSNGIRMFGNHFEKLSGGTDTLANDLIAIVENMTGTNGGGGGTATSTGGNGDSNSITNTNGEMNNYTSGVNTHGGAGRTKDESDVPEGASSSSKNVSSNGDSDGEFVSVKSPEEGIGEMVPDGSGTITTNNSGGSVTYNSGDIVNVGDETYTFYGAYEKPNGEIVALFEGENESLWYKKADGSFERVQATHTNGSGQKVAEDATSLSLGTEKQYSVHGYPYNAKVSLSIDGQTITSNDISTSITYTGDAATNITQPVSNANTGAFANLNANNAPIETSGGLKESYRGEIDGTSVNGSTLITASAMSDFSDYTTTQGGDITLKIPQGQYVQWDSPSGGTGFEFPTGNGAVYLRWDSTAAGGQGAYHIVDEYGNVTNNRDFTLDGFNDNGGINGGVWK